MPTPNKTARKNAFGAAVRSGFDTFGKLYRRRNIAHCCSLQRRSIDESKRSTFPHYWQCTLTQRLFCCCEYAVSPTAVVPEVAPAMDIPAMSCAQPARGHWCKKEDVERNLELERQGINTYFCDQRRLRRNSVAWHPRKLFFLRRKCTLITSCWYCSRRTGRRRARASGNTENIRRHFILELVFGVGRSPPPPPSGLSSLLDSDVVCNSKMLLVKHAFLFGVCPRERSSLSLAGAEEEAPPEREADRSPSAAERLYAGDGRDQDSYNKMEEDLVGWLLRTRTAVDCCMIAQLYFLVVLQNLIDFNGTRN